MIQSIQRNLAWRAVLIAGLVAGTVHLLVNVIFTPLILQVNPIIVLRYMGSLVLGQAVVTQDSLVPAVVGVIVHYVISLILTLVIAICIHRWGLLVGIIGGAILGLAFYGINLYTMTLLYPWFFAINSTVLLLSHVVFGAVAGGVYETLDTYDMPLTTTTEGVR
jgi:hypothetical protein